MSLLYYETIQILPSPPLHGADARYPLALAPPMFNLDSGSQLTASSARYSAYLIGLKRKYKITSNLKSFITDNSFQLNSFQCPQLRSRSIPCGNHRNAGLSKSDEIANCNCRLNLDQSIAE